MHSDTKPKPSTETHTCIHTLAHAHAHAHAHTHTLSISLLLFLSLSHTQTHARSSAAGKKIQTRQTCMHLDEAKVVNRNTYMYVCMFTHTHVHTNTLLRQIRAYNQEKYHQDPLAKGQTIKTRQIGMHSDTKRKSLHVTHTCMYACTHTHTHKHTIATSKAIKKDKHT